MIRPGRNLLADARHATVLLAVLACASCGPGTVDDDAPDGTTTAAVLDTDAVGNVVGDAVGDAPSDGAATLTLTGGVARYPGTYDYLANCSFIGGGLTLTVFPENPSGVGPEMTTFFLPQPVAAFSQTTYHGRYDVGEGQSGGQVLNYFGDAQITVTGMSRSANDIVVADFEVSGQGDDGLQVTLSAHCLVPGA